MTRVGLMCAAGAIAGGIFLSAQAQIPEPRRQFGAGITPAFEGWFYNADGSRSFLIGYYNRNSQQELIIPIGPNNRIEGPDGPGIVDRGQPTHFLPGRQWGMFSIPVPKDFKPTDSFVWTLVWNGQSTSIPFRLNPDYVMNPLSEIAVGNTPPAIRFDQNGNTLQGPVALLSAAPSRTASAATPLPLSVWATDDLKYTSGSNAPMSARPPVLLRWSQYRGPGKVTFDKARVEVEKSGGEGAAFTGHATTTATFSEPGDYVLHLIANDYSGDGGGGGFGCCWTTGLVKVSVKP